MAWLSERK